MSNCIISTMIELYPELTDPITEEINCTLLAEETSHELNSYEDNDDIPELYYELAYLVSELFRKADEVIGAYSNDTEVEAERIGDLAAERIRTTAHNYYQQEANHDTS